MKPIFIQEVKKSQMPYDTVGNFFMEEGILYIEVAKQKGYVEDDIDLQGVAFHEFCEVLLCKQAGITIKEIDKWDLAHQDTDIEPGEIKGCPYFYQHAFANKLEIMFVKELLKNKKLCLKKKK